MKKYDYVLVGSGLFAGVWAYLARKKGKTCLVVEKRDHIGGNIYCQDVEGIHVHKYGAHIFHTSNREVWDFVNSLVEFNRYTNSPVANYKGEMYNMPFNMNTFSKMWNISTPEEARAIIEKQKEKKEYYDSLGETIVYTGTLDSFYQYCFGKLEYRSLRFETEVKDTDNYQGVAVVNYTDRETPYTRIIEHKHFEFGTQPKTVITREYPADWQEGMEPYYPVNDQRNQELYEKYAALAKKEKNVIFGGRLAEYQYYDMDKVIESAFNRAGDYGLR